MTSLGDVLARFAADDIDHRQEREQPACGPDCEICFAARRKEREQTVRAARGGYAVCTRCQDERHEECSGVVDVRDETPEGEVREWEAFCTCNAPACTGDVDEVAMDRAQDAADDARKDEEDDDIAF